MKFIPIIIIILLFIIFGDRCLKGMIITFKKNPLLSILLIIFFIPAYIIWVIYEGFNKASNTNDNIIDAEFKIIDEEEE